MLLNLFFKSIQIFSLETKTFSSIRDDFLIINVFQKQKPRIFTIAAKIIQNYQSPILALHPKLSRIYNDGMKIHNGFFGFTAMQSFSSYLCHSSAYSKKKIYMWARKGLPISLMTIILHRTKAVISSITPLYIVKREIKYKKTHPVHRMIYPKQ